MTEKLWTFAFILGFLCWWWISVEAKTHKKMSIYKIILTSESFIIQNRVSGLSLNHYKWFFVPSPPLRSSKTCFTGFKLLLHWKCGCEIIFLLLWSSMRSNLGCSTFSNDRLLPLHSELSRFLVQNPTSSSLH